jgi:membrane protein
LRSFRWRDIKALLTESFDEWSRHKAQRLGASLAFYTLLSLTPLLLAAVSIAGLVFGATAAETHLVEQVQGLVGDAGAMAIQVLLEGSRRTAHGVLGALLGLLTLFFGASGVLIELHDALNTIWEVPPRQRSGTLQTIKGFLRERLFSFTLVVAIGFLLLVSLIVNTALAVVGAFSASILPLPEAVLHILNSLFSFVVVTGLFAAIYRVMPDCRIEWRDVVLGSAVTAFLFEIGKTLIGLYLGKASFASTYGAAASIVVIIVWVYYSSQVFFLGAEFTRIFASRYGSRPQAQAAVVASATAQVPNKL